MQWRACRYLGRAMSFGVDRSIAFGHDTARMASASSRPAPIAWLLAPALLLFVLFFVLPFGVMAALALFPSNPATNPNAFLTTRRYARFVVGCDGGLPDAPRAHVVIR